MEPETREQQLRRRLAAQLERQAERAAALPDAGASLTAGQLAEPAVLVAGAQEGQAGPAALRLPASGAPPVTIAVPVHDAPDDLERCVWAIARNTTYPARLLLIDDASVDPRTDAVIEWAAQLDGVQVLRNTENLGFPATVNRALRASAGDLVLLNSDTEVGPRWLEQLVLAAYADPGTATATPLSDNAGAFSAPERDIGNLIPVNLDSDGAARLVAAIARGERPRAPTGNGFCMYMKRTVIDAVGEMDPVSFSRGYGEENDWCMRAGSLGYGHVVDDRTYVHHRREASFGAAKQALVANARARMNELHPDYQQKVAEFLADEGMARARERVGAALRLGAAAGSPRPRLLFVVHEGGGGAVATNRDLMGALADEFECYCFSSDRFVMHLTRVEGLQEELLQEWTLERPLLLRDFSRPEYRGAFALALDRVAPELVHIRHLYKHTFDPPRMAAARELPIVMSFHDHYFICPTIHLLDERGRYCAGQCTPGIGNCPTVRAGSTPVLKHAWVHQWREEAEAALGLVDAFVTTSAYTREINQRYLAPTRSRPFELIEHGRDLTQLHGLGQAPEPGGRIRIIVPGHLDRHKGADLLAAMCELDQGARLELHFLGAVPEHYQHLGVVHGAYERDHLAAHVQQIRPAFVGIFSVTGESYSHALTEAWAAGVPALVTDLGAQTARVRERGGGFVIPHDDPAAALEAVLAAADDTDAYRREEGRANAADLPTVADMARRYGELYRRVISSRRSLAAPPAAHGSALGRELWHVALLSGSEQAEHTLLARRLLHPSVRWKLRAGVHADAAELPAETGVVVAEQDSLSSAEAQALVDHVRERELPLVLSCERPPEDEEDSTLLGAATLVLVPSAALRAVYARHHPRVELLAPALDARLFLDGTRTGAPPAPERTEDVPVRLVVAAPRADPRLDLLRAVLERLRANGRLRYELEVLATQPPTVAQGFYEPVLVPDPAREYGRYAQLMSGLAPRWQIGLVPCGEDQRAELTYLELAALGVPGIYAASGDNRSVQATERGLVCRDDDEAWADAIERLANDAALAARIRERAWRDVTENRLMHTGAPRLLEALARAFAGPQGVSSTILVADAR